MEEPELQQYVHDLFGGEDRLLSQMREEAVAQGLPSIQVPFDLGRMLQILIIATRAQRILEIGTLFGYSSILMARALPPEGRITSLEVNPKHAALARQNAEKAGVADRIEVREGPGMESMAKLAGQQFDLIFIDADKASYPEYLECALELAHAGTVIVGDNAWRHGEVTQGGTPDSNGMATFNRELAGNPRLLSVIVPRLDGGDAFGLSVVR